MPEIKEITFLRGDNEYEAHIGVAPDGSRSECYYQTITPDARGVRKRLYATDFHAKATNERIGNFRHTLVTMWKEIEIYPNGEFIESTEKEVPMATNEADKVFFLLGLGSPILWSMLNGHVRSFLGFNNYKVLDGAGNLIQYPIDELMQPPTNDYNYIAPTYPNNPILPDEDDTNTTDS